MSNRNDTAVLSKKKHWGLRILLYIILFTASFIGGIISKTADPFGGKYKADWSDAVGKVHKDISYGAAESNKFDLYVPADGSKESYGLVVYIHAGGFTTGDKSDDVEMLQWLCSKGYVSAGINYTLRDEAHPDTSVYSQFAEIRESSRML